MTRLKDKSRELMIIAGATRCGTTALFEYLSRHPRIVSASIKETRFFLDNEYPGRSEYRYEAGIDAYWDYFQDVGEECTHLLEATSDYMFAPGVPGRIRSMVGCPHLVFILRDPVARFLSWHRFARQNAIITSDTSLSDFIDMQKRDEGAVAQHKRVLEQGRYPLYLRRFLTCFSSERLHVTFLEDMAEDPLGCISELLKAMHLDSRALSSDTFEKINPSFVAKSPKMHRMYTHAGIVLRTKLRRHPTVQRFVRGLNRRLIAPVYRMFNSGGGGRSESEIASPGGDDRAIRFIREYYDGVEEEVQELTGRRPNWSSIRVSS